MKAWLAGVIAEVESGLFGVVTGRVTLLVVGMFSESGVRGATSLLFLDGDGVTGSLGCKNRGGAEARPWTRGFLGVTAFGLKIGEGNALSKTTGRGCGRLGVTDAKPSGPDNRGRLDGV